MQNSLFSPPLKLQIELEAEAKENGTNFGT